LKKGKRYGLFTAISMVVGSVIGSGVFFKTETLINITKGNGWEALTAWLIGGLSMILCLLSFVCVVRYVGCERGLLGIAENTVGERYAYYTGWFMATVYYPALASVLSWLSARYTLLVFGAEHSDSGLCMLVSCLYLIVCFTQNLLSPRVSGKVQITATVLKLIPLVLMIVFGLLRGINGGNLQQNLFVEKVQGNSGTALFPAISAVLFAYEGWIAGLSIGSELKNSKKNMPLALLIGGGIVTAVYILYYMGIMGSVRSEMFMEQGQNGIKFAFASVFGKYATDLLLIFVAISCFGALNGMMFSAGRAMYQLRHNNNVTEQNSLPENLAVPFVTELVLSAIWLFLFFGFSISGKPLFGGFGFDVSEIPVITVYSLYIPIFFMFLKRTKKELSFSAKVIVVLGIFASATMVICAFFAHVKDVADYLCLLIAIMLTGSLFHTK